MSKFKDLIGETNYDSDLPFTDIEEGCSEPNCTCNMFKEVEENE